MENIGLKLQSFFIKCKRVWLSLRKPTKKEFQMTAKISAIGIVLLGVIGFIISLLVKALA